MSPPQDSHVSLGLSADEAARRLRAEGWNELPRARRRGLAGIVREALSEPMFQLLLAAGGVYLLLGDRVEALILLGIAMVSMLITIVQQNRTESALEALRELSSPRALVIRDGQQRRVPGREVVRGDCVLLAEGDRVPADLRLRESQDLQADESLLTGESVPVAKHADTAAPGDGDTADRVYAATLITRGSGVGIATATGVNTELGRIGRMLERIGEAPTALHRQTRTLVRRLAAIGIAISAIVALLYGLARHAWIDGLLAGIALAMSMLPEEFPVVLTVFLALGARRMSHRRVLTRRPAAIEALGAATVLCTDKTGTLTENRMRIAELECGGRHVDAAPLPEEFASLLDAAVLACKPIAVDPMDRAVHALHGAAPPLQLVREYGLTPQRPAVTMVWSAEGSETLRIGAKGAPEAVAALCGLDPDQCAAMRARVDEMAQRGLRVLGVASGEWRGALPEDAAELGLRWCGLVGFSDPLRPAAAAAIRECREAGIRVVMITGDYPATARAIAQQAGIDSAQLLTGAELDALSDEALRARIGNVSIYARVQPQHKLRIVQALKAGGDVVAMTGDGVNDAPSLKAADIGVAMGGRGTDVAREAASLVLLDDDFGSLVTAVRHGRRIYDNLRKAMCYILAVHVPIAGLSLLPLLLGWPLMLLPLHIVFLELLIDPVCSIAFEDEAEETDLMRRRPRDPDEPLFSRRLVLWGLVQGTAVLLLLMGLSLYARERLPDAELRALCFAALVATNVGLIFLNRSFSDSLLLALRQPNRALWWVLLLSLGLLAAVLYLPPTRQAFGFGVLGAHEALLAFASGAGLLILLESSKRWLAPRRR